MLEHDDTPSLSALITFARRMRQQPTRSEALLYGQLRKRKLGARFRRQHVFPLGYIVDFFAPCHKLVVEVDGGVHRDPARARGDGRRQAELEAVYGIRFVRVSAELVERDPRAAARSSLALCAARVMTLLRTLTNA